MVSKARSRIQTEDDLRLHYGILENQVKVLKALELAYTVPFLGADRQYTAQCLMEKVAQAVLVNCQDIWRLSGGEVDGGGEEETP